MLFSDLDRCLYRQSPLVEVICQLRFPTILTIQAQEPAAFQEAIRHEYPLYLPRQEQGAPRVYRNAEGVTEVRQDPPVNNYSFLSEDHTYKVNLSEGFVSLSTVRYSRWEDFAQRLDRVLAVCYEVYHPDYFERVGLRYINGVSREQLFLEDTPWRDLIAQPYLGILGEADVTEAGTRKCSLEVERRLEDDTQLKIHAGPGMVKAEGRSGKPRFILDFDLALGGRLEWETIPQRLEGLHRKAGELFRGAVTDELHEAMGPMEP